jgi:osomolarity two-component system response regulator SSK1
MQALIDFDGWRRWKDFADKSENTDSTSKLSLSYHSVAASKKNTAPSPTLAANPDTMNGVKKDDDVKEKERERKGKRKSLVVPPPALQEEIETPPASGSN